MRQYTPAASAVGMRLSTRCAGAIGCLASPAIGESRLEATVFGRAAQEEGCLSHAFAPEACLGSGPVVRPKVLFICSFGALRRARAGQARPSAQKGLERVVKELAVGGQQSQTPGHTTPRNQSDDSQPGTLDAHWMGSRRLGDWDAARSATGAPESTHREAVGEAEAEV